MYLIELDSGEGRREQCLIRQEETPFALWEERRREKVDVEVERPVTWSIMLLVHTCLCAVYIGVSSNNTITASQGG